MPSLLVGLVLVVVLCRVAAAGPVIERGAYRIELASDAARTRGRVVFANGEEMGIDWDEGHIVKLDGVDIRRHRLPPHVADDRFAGAILVARDLAPQIDAKPVIRAELLDTKPPLVLIRQGTDTYLDRVGLVRASSPDTNVYACLLGRRCELAIEGPDRQGTAIFEWDKLVQRPQVVDQPRRAWKEIVPGRIARMRAALVDCELARAAGDRYATLIHLRDADDAIDDIVAALPMSMPGAIDFEILRDDTRAALARAGTIDTDDIAALRVALSKLRASLPK